MILLNSIHTQKETREYRVVFHAVRLGMVSKATGRNVHTGKT